MLNYIPLLSEAQLVTQALSAESTYILFVHSVHLVVSLPWQR